MIMKTHSRITKIAATAPLLIISVMPPVNPDCSCERMAYVPTPAAMVRGFGRSWPSSRALS